MKQKTVNRIHNLSELCLLGLSCFFAFTAQAQDSAAKPTNEVSLQESRLLDLGGLIGFHADPGNFAIAAHADLHMSQYLSFGPLLQAGFWNTRTFFTATMGGKFHLPIHEVAGLELNYQAGAGYFYKRDNGFNLHNFILTTGPGVDLFVEGPFAIEAMFLVNATNDAVDDLFYSGLVGLKFVL
jgi:hypothetical protein